MTGRTRLGLLLGLVLALAATGASADTYLWTDEAGTTHSVDNLESVPREYRDSVNYVKDAGGGDRRATRPERRSGSHVRKPPKRPAGPSADFSIDKALPQMGFSSFIGMLLAAFLLKRACRMADQDDPGFLKALGVALLSDVLVSVAFYLLAQLLVADGISAVLAAQGSGIGDLLGDFLLLFGLGLASWFLINLILFRLLLADGWIGALMVQLMYLVLVVLLVVALGAGMMCVGVCVS